MTGGYPITISADHVGNGTDVTVVRLCGVNVPIVEQSTRQVVITAPARFPQSCTLYTESTSSGSMTYPNAFTYEPRTFAMSFVIAVSVACWLIQLTSHR